MKRGALDHRNSGGLEGMPVPIVASDCPEDFPDQFRRGQLRNTGKEKEESLCEVPVRRQPFQSRNSQSLRGAARARLTAVFFASMRRNASRINAPS